MRLVFLCGPPCSGKTTMAHTLAQHGDVVIDYTTDHTTVTQAHHAPGTGTAWVTDLAPRPTHRHHLATTYHAPIYLLDPGEQVCRRRAAATRPTGTARSIGHWYHHYTPWSGDRDPTELDPTWVGVSRAPRGLVDIDPGDL